MTTLHAPAALLPDGWARDVRVTLEGQRIAAVEIGRGGGPATSGSPGARCCRRCRTCTATPSSGRWRG